MDGRLASQPGGGNETLARAALALGLAWMAAGIALFLWLSVTFKGQLFGGLGMLLGLFFFASGVLVGALQALVAPRLSMGRAAGALQAWSTGLGIVVALVAWPTIAVFTSNWFLLILPALLAPQWVLHGNVDRPKAPTPAATPL